MQKAVETKVKKIGVGKTDKRETKGTEGTEEGRREERKDDGG